MARKSVLLITIFTLFVLFCARKLESGVIFDDFIENYEEFLPNRVFVPSGTDCTWLTYYNVEYQQFVSCRLPIEDDCYNYAVIYGEVNIITTAIFSVKAGCGLLFAHLRDKYGRPDVSIISQRSSTWYWDRVIAVSKDRSMYDNYFSKISYLYLR